MLVKWNPRRSLLNINDDLDRMFEEFMSTRMLEPTTMEISPRVNVEENDNEWILTAELPGVTKDDIELNFRDNILTLSGEKKIEKEDKKKNYHHIERSYGRFSRSFAINSSIVTDKIEAKFKDGILTVVLPKAEEEKPKLIDIKVK
ncbi:MAG TPA: Hsp20/alpha crystallin family protein [Caldithrix abyssi]|uniref:Hsp20/alpha crystallin family protein n=1 Tax=Caldithrix abyssi TaxID=187145 RepID=A0A7V1PVE5_CALAY|nr:Hsp20/alpha crystallin family protein [Caldithrix abyssi]